MGLSTTTTARAVAGQHAAEARALKLFEVFRWLGAVILGIGVSYGAAQYSQAQRDALIQRNTDRLAVVESQTVPRGELQTRWDAQQRQLDRVERTLERLDQRSDEMMRTLSSRPPR